MLLLGPRPIITRTIGEPSTLARSFCLVRSFLFSLSLSSDSYVFLVLATRLFLFLRSLNAFIDAWFPAAEPRHPSFPCFVRGTFVRCDSFTMDPFNGCTHDCACSTKVYRDRISALSDRLGEICSWDTRVGPGAGEGCCRCDFIILYGGIERWNTIVFEDTKWWSAYALNAKSLLKV